MRVPLSWLREYVDFDLPPEALAERLTLLGMEVKGIDRIGTDWSRVVVGELLAVEPHPNSNRLSLTTVTVGEGSPTLSIVCGATNIAVGQRVPVALVGSVLPGDRHIETARLAGVESQGMLCSGDELGLSSDADGILILPAGRPLGVPLETSSGTWSWTWTSSPTGAMRCPSSGSRARSPPRPARRCAGRTSRWPNRATRRPSTCRVDVQDAERLPAVRGPLPRRRDRRAVALRGRQTTAGGRHATHQQRRRRQQLRDARAGQAHPHVRRRRHHRRPDHRPDGHTMASS